MDEIRWHSMVTTKNLSVTEGRCGLLLENPRGWMCPPGELTLQLQLVQEQKTRLLYVVRGFNYFFLVPQMNLGINSPPSTLPTRIVVIELPHTHMCITGFVQQTFKV